QDSVYHKSTAARSIQAYYQFIQHNSDNPNVSEAWRNLYKLYMIDYSPARIAEFRIDYPDYPFVEDLMMDIELASKHFLPIKMDSLWGFIDTEGNLMIEAQYSSVEPFNEGLALVVKNGKLGFINKSADVVIPIIYDDAESFESSLAIVAKEDDYGIVDRTNKVVLPLKYEYVGKFYDGLAIVANDTAYGYVNQSGEVVIPLTLEYAGDFDQGLALVEQDGKKGVINTQGRTVVPMEYNWLESFQDNGLARAKKDSLYGLIDRQAAVVLPFEYDAIGTFSDGMALVANGGQYGYINDSAHWVIDPKFDFRRDALNWGSFDGAYAKYMLKEKFGIIDTVGNRIFPAIFENIGNYNDSSLIAVKRRGKWGFANQEVSLAIPYQFEFAETFVHGVAKVKLNGFWGLINKEGDWLLEAEYDDIQILDFGYLLKKEDKMGVSFLNLEEAIPLEYDEIRIYNEEFLTLENDDNFGYYHIPEGKIIHLNK
ncbi:MAG: WG repeat-containing protein, partial [Vicingaceae bacterium]